MQLKCAITHYWVIVSSTYSVGNILAHAQLFGYKLLAMAKPVAWQRGLKIIGFMTSLTTYYSIANISN